MNPRTLALSILLPALALPYAASQTAAPTLAASAPTAVPTPGSVFWSGRGPDWTDVRPLPDL
jgi:hypothetical protein